MYAAIIRYLHQNYRCSGYVAVNFTAYWDHLRCESALAATVSMTVRMYVHLHLFFLPLYPITVLLCKDSVWPSISPPLYPSFLSLIVFPIYFFPFFFFVPPSFFSFLLPLCSVHLIYVLSILPLYYDAHLIIKHNFLLSYIHYIHYPFSLLPLLYFFTTYYAII